MKSKIPKSAITERQLKKLIKAAARGHTSISAWAVDNGITSQQVTAFIRKTQGAGLKLPEVLGYRPQVVFLPLKEPLISVMVPPRRPTKRPSKKVNHSLPPVEKRGIRPGNDREETKTRLKGRKR